MPFVWSIEPVYIAKDGNFTTHIYGTRTTDRILPVLAKPGYAVAGLSATPTITCSPGSKSNSCASAE